MSQIKLNGGSDLDPRLTTGRLETERVAEGDAAPREANAVAPRGADSIRVSERATAIGELTARIRQLPDIRHERVEHFRALLQAGAYHPPAEEITDAMLRDGETSAEPI